ncbi:MAG: hypothetical protein ACXVCO_18950, partial [Ktedonobacterales bacterium]
LFYLSRACRGMRLSGDSYDAWGGRLGAWVVRAGSRNCGWERVCHGLDAAGRDDSGEYGITSHRGQTKHGLYTDTESACIF